MAFHVSHQQAGANDCAVVLSLSTEVFRKCAVYVSPSGLTSSFICLILTNLTTDLSLALQLRLQRLPRFPCTTPAHFLPQLCRNIAVVFHVHRYQCSPKRLSTTLRGLSAVSWSSPRADPLNSGAVRASLKLLRLPTVSSVTQTTFFGFPLQATSFQRLRSGFHTRASRHVSLADSKINTASGFRTRCAPSPSVSR